MENTESIRSDVLEIEELLKIAQRPNIISILKNELKKLKENTHTQRYTHTNTHTDTCTDSHTQLSDLKAEAPQQIFPALIPQSISYSPISTYSWDQENDIVKIYVTVPGVHTLEKESIEFATTNAVVDLKIHELNKRNLRFCVKKLCSAIIPQSCRYRVRKDMVSITLKKVTPNHWPQLQFKESLMKNKPSENIKNDPTAGMMDMMRDLYQSGDDDMKRNIAKAWTEAQDKRDRPMDFDMPKF